MLISNKRLMCSAPGTSNSFFWRLILLLLIELLERQLFVWLIMVEMMDIWIELCESTSEGIYVTHSRAKQRSDKLSSRFLVPRTRTDDSRSADIVDQYIGTLQENLGRRPTIVAVLKSLTNTLEPLKRT